MYIPSVIASEVKKGGYKSLVKLTANPKCFKPPCPTLYIQAQHTQTYRI